MFIAWHRKSQCYKTVIDAFLAILKTHQQAMFLIAKPTPVPRLSSLSRRLQKKVYPAPTSLIPQTSANRVSLSVAIYIPYLPTRAVLRCGLCDQTQELGLDAVDDRNIFSALSRSACSTTCFCIAFRTVQSYDFFRSVYRNCLCISGLGIFRHTVICWNNLCWLQLKSSIYLALCFV